MRAVVRVRFLIVALSVASTLLGCSGSSSSTQSNETHTPAAIAAFSAPSGTYTSALTVSLTSSTPGAQIYYTTNATTPTTSSTLYSAPITVSTSETIESIVVAAGYSNSPVTIATYTINAPVPVASAPTFSVPAGTYTSAQTVSFASSTPGAQIYYTTNGTTPTTSSTLYSGPITVSTSETIQALAAVSGYTNSPVASATFTINLPITPSLTATLSASTFALTSPATLTVQVSCNAACGQVSLTIDGNPWQTGSLNSTGAYTISTFPSLSVGAHMLQASFLGGPEFNAATSGQVAFTITAGNSGSPHVQLSTYLLQWGISGLTRDITLTNTGSAPLQISSVATYTPYFSETDNCRSAIPANATCTISVTDHTPADMTAQYPYNNNCGICGIAATNRQDQLVITSNDPNGTAGASLHDNSAEQVLISNVSFGPTVVGSPATQTFSVIGFFSSISDCPATLTGADFSLTTPQIDYVAQSFSICLFSLSFNPASPGSKSGRIVFSTDGSYLPLYGIAVTTSSAIATLSPASTTIQDLTGPQQVTLSNFGSTAMNIQAISVSSGFNQTNNCGSSLSAQFVCTITIASTLPVVAQQIQGMVTVTDDAGTQSAQLINVIDTVFNFGTWAIGSGSSSYAFSPYLGAASATGPDLSDFDFTTTRVALNLQEGAAFQPKAAGQRSATLTFSEYPSTFALNYLLLGTGIASPGSGALLTFGSVPTVVEPVGIESQWMPLSINNSGTTTVTFSGPSSVTITGPNSGDFSPEESLFQPTGYCATPPLTPGFQCRGEYHFQPTSPGTRTATYSVTDATSGQTFSTAITGIATPAPPAISAPSSISAQVGTSTPVSITVTPQGGDAVVTYFPDATSTTDGVFTFTKSTCAQGESPCLINLTYAPVTGGNTAPTIIVVDTVTGSPNTVVLNGSIAPGTLSLSSTQLSFATRAVNTTSVPQTITVTATNGTAYVYTPTLTGPNASEFSMTSTCAPNIAEALDNSSCTISVSFAPVSAGSKSATVTVPLSNNQSLTANLTGVGQ